MNITDNEALNNFFKVLEYAPGSLQNFNLKFLLNWAPHKKKKKSGKGYCSSKSRFWVGVKHWCVGMSMCQNLDVFSHTQAQEKWKSLDYQIVSNTKDINTKISAIHHSCRPVSVATVIYSRAKIHLDFLSLSLSLHPSLTPHTKNHI